MPKSMSLIGDAKGSPSPSSPETAAQEYFVNKVFGGNFAPKPLISRLRPDQRARFEKELKRLEAERSRQQSDAVKQVKER
jgi:hypothetical protein